MRLLIIADDDDLAKIAVEGPFDVLISCGDLSDRVILQTAQRAGCAHIFAVKGNHDSSAPFPSPIVDLHLRTERVGGLIFGGFQGAWKYKPRGNYLYEQDAVAGMIALFPPVDVFVAHNSPRHIHDRDDEIHIGFEAFTAYIQRSKPRFFFHGHQHVSRETRIGTTNVVGIYGMNSFEL
jgi:Icc-related predicted phosphoesterase